MATPFRFRLVTPEGLLYDGETAYVHVRGREGDMGILAHHLPLVTSLKIAPVEVDSEDGRMRFAVHGGFLEVGTEGVVVLAQIAERAEEVSVERARDALGRARERLSHPGDGVDAARAASAERRALCRLEVSGAVGVESAGAPAAR